MTTRFSFIPEAVILDGRLTAQEFRTYASIAFFGANKQDGCWPSNSKLAAMLAIDRRSIRRHITNLVKYGHLTREKRARDNGSSTSNTYRITIVIDTGQDEIGNEGGVGQDCPRGWDSSVLGGWDGRVLPKNETNKEQYKENNKNIKKSVKVSLEQWEKSVGGVLCVEHVKSWVDGNKLDHQKIKMLIIEFRDRMVANGNQYANFAAAFKDWMRRGFLSKKIVDARITPSEHKHRNLANQGLKL